jgi:diguanylate cyclase (GGDEF)-like protein
MAEGSHRTTGAGSGRSAGKAPGSRVAGRTASPTPAKQAGAIGLLGGVPIFAALGEEELRQILPALKGSSLRSGEVLFRQGEPGAELFIVLSGSMGISVRLPDGKDLEIASFGPGDFFGEMSIFEKEPRSATCYATRRCRLLSLSAKGFFALVQRAPASAAAVMERMLSITRRRLEDTGELLSDMVQWGEAASRRAITDDLTGLYNRRYLEQALEEQLRRAAESGHSLAMVMVDLDRFREINEGYSQAVGDQVIVAAAQVFQRRLRPADAAARYGGDEFTFLLPDSDTATALAICEGIRKEVESLEVLRDMKGPIRRVTTSQGVACFPEHARDVASLRQAADAALYRAKELGRNRVAVAEGSAAPG